MTSPERAGALQEAVEKATEELRASYFDGGPGRYVEWWAKDAPAVLRRLYLSAQVSALESVAKEQCKYCWNGRKVVRAVDGLWWHEGFRRVGCHSGRIWDALARLRAGSPEQAKEKHDPR